MQQAVTLLDEAKQVYICGFRASFPIAWSLFYVYRLFNRQVSLIDGLASNIEVFTREINAEDCLLLTSFSPYSRESLDVSQCCQAGRGTDYRHHRLSGFAAGASGGLHVAFLPQQPLFFPFDSVRYGRRRVFAGDAGCPPR
ncbi:RpiR family transcriptional regulator [Klebsiella michiganensis]|uniref:RpiR family transcriptional regulator n=1 Tax=Klebsiella michiganensis TaxID=1134687 RepID=A0A7H4MZE9_9ENTR|nr:RpiR family transcriptional regulator [Klebsiella michiganensis]